MASNKNKILDRNCYVSETTKTQKLKIFLFKKHLHLFAAIFSLIALRVSYYYWKDETLWVMKWMIIYTAFAILYWSIKPLIKWIREKWSK
jgi:hypothetical protein